MSGGLLKIHKIRHQNVININFLLSLLLLYRIVYRIYSSQALRRIVLDLMNLSVRVVHEKPFPYVLWSVLQM